MGIIIVFKLIVSRVFDIATLHVVRSNKRATKDARRCLSLHPSSLNPPRARLFRSSTSPKREKENSTCRRPSVVLNDVEDGCVLRALLRRMISWNNNKNNNNNNTLLYRNCTSDQTWLLDPLDLCNGKGTGTMP